MIKTHRTRLAKGLGHLLYNSTYSMQACLKDQWYVINNTQEGIILHKPHFNDGHASFLVYCEVCISGAVMAKTLKVYKQKDTSFFFSQSISPEDQDRLWALKCIKNFDFKNAFIKVYGKITKQKTIDFLHDLQYRWYGKWDQCEPERYIKELNACAKELVDFKI